MRALNFYFAIPQSVVLAVINDGILVIFWQGSLRRWVRCTQGGPCMPQVALPREGKHTVSVVTPSLPEVMAGDLIAGGALAAILWVVFQPSVMGRIISLISTRDLTSHRPPARRPVRRIVPWWIVIRCSFICRWDCWCWR